MFMKIQFTLNSIIAIEKTFQKKVFKRKTRQQKNELSFMAVGEI